jgi:hypothetical protein
MKSEKILFYSDFFIWIVVKSDWCNINSKNIGSWIFWEIVFGLFQTELRFWVMWCLNMLCYRLIKRLPKVSISLTNGIKARLWCVVWWNDTITYENVPWVRTKRCKVWVWMSDLWVKGNGSWHELDNDSWS